MYVPLALVGVGVLVSVGVCVAVAFVGVLVGIGVSDGVGVTLGGGASASEQLVNSGRRHRRRTIAARNFMVVRFVSLFMIFTLSS